MRGHLFYLQFVKFNYLMTDEVGNFLRELHCVSTLIELGRW